MLQLSQSQGLWRRDHRFLGDRRHSLDLIDINFPAGATTATYADNGAHTGGVLTVTDGTHTANFTLSGDYSAAAFTTDGKGRNDRHRHAGAEPGSPRPSTPWSTPYRRWRPGGGSSSVAAPVEPALSASRLLAAPHSSGRGFG